MSRYSPVTYSYCNWSCNASPRSCLFPISFRHISHHQNCFDLASTLLIAFFSPQRLIPPPMFPERRDSQSPDLSTSSSSSDSTPGAKSAKHSIDKGGSVKFKPPIERTQTEFKPKLNSDGGTDRSFSDVRIGLNDVIGRKTLVATSTT